MTTEDLKDFCIKAMTNHPSLKFQITEAYSLALEEIDEGGSECNECELAQSQIEELIKEL